jgi:hypothetical protein
LIFVWNLLNAYKEQVILASNGMRMKEKIPKGAPRFMKRKGEMTDARVFEEVKKRPESTIREIAESLGWTNGRVDASVNRLVTKGKLRAQHYFRRGVLVKKVFPQDYSTVTGVIEIPKEMTDESLWEETAYVYALSRTTIGLSPNKRKDWEQLAVKKNMVPITKNVNDLVIRLPPFFIDFYQLENSETRLSTVGNSALVTVEPIILPVELPQTFPILERIGITGTVYGLGALTSVAEPHPTLKWNPKKEEEFKKISMEGFVGGLFKPIESGAEMMTGTSEANALLVKEAA